MTLLPRQYTPSLFIQSLISFHQVCLFPFFSSVPFYSAGYSCLCQIQSLLPSWPVSLSLCALHRIFVLLPLSSLLPLFSSSYSISFTTDYLLFCPPHFYLPPFLNILSPPQVFPRSLSVRLFFRWLYSSPLGLLSSSASLLLCDLSPSIFPSPFSRPFSLFAALFSLTLGARALLETLSPQWDIQQEKELVNKLWDSGGRGSGGAE